MNDFVEKTTYSPVFSYLGITPEFTLQEYIEKKTYNEYEFRDVSGNVKTCFKKYIMLVDYVKFLIGKYKNDTLSILPSDHLVPTNLFQETVQSCHNYAYVDSFFYYLTNLLNQKGFVHGIQVYDSYVCIQKNIEINVADDFEYICDSNYFNDKLNTLFHFKDESVFSKKVQSPIQISDENVELEMEELSSSEDEGHDNIHEITADITHEDKDVDEDVDVVKSASDSDSESSIDTVDNDSELSHTDEEEEGDSHSNDSHSVNSMETDIDLVLVIKEAPAQVVSIEKCENTIDFLLEKNELRIEELESAMFQVIVILYTYQNLFDFTHNDLHTNNIMYVTTEEKFLSYKIKDKYYKIPTFGKIYKIIDFGRAIYTVNDKIMCSDSFSEHGMAYTQYNFEPFYNSQKPKILPNKSFDLCRLGCSIIDFIIDDLNDLDKFKKVPIYDLIISWIYDDSGTNILYKKNGEDRYPDFKLYKMIARIVHHHVPEKQFGHVCFEKYIYESLDTFMDLDKLIQQKFV